MNITPRSDGAQMFANRLRKNIKHLSRWRKREGICCYRLYDADMPEYALAIDVYEGDKRWVHAQEYEAPNTIAPEKANLRLQEALEVTLDILEIGKEQLYVKVRRQQKGRSQYEKMDSRGEFHEVMEGKCRLLVNFSDYLDTGLFLDHRTTRGMIEALSTGKRFLNMFAYTGTASVHAAMGGASSTTTIDMSRTYLQWSQRNMELNGFKGKCHQYIQANCISWLDTVAGKQRYDLIFLDPPSFSVSKRMEGTFDIQRDHVTLIKKTTRLLHSDGILIFSNNLRNFNMDKEALPLLKLNNISHRTLPRDFERNPRIHNCWEIRHADHSAAIQTAASRRSRV